MNTEQEMSEVESKTKKRTKAKSAEGAEKKTQGNAAENVQQSKLHIDQALTDKIRNAIENKKVIIGEERIEKSLGKISKIIVSRSISSKLERTLSRAEAEGVEISRLEVDSSELAIACRKPFSISVIAFVK